MTFNLAVKNFTGGNWIESGGIVKATNDNVYDLMNKAGVDYDVQMIPTYFKNRDGNFVESGEYASYSPRDDRFIRGGFGQSKVVRNFKDMFFGAFGELYKELILEGFMPANVAKGNNGDQIVIQLRLPKVAMIKNRAHETFLNIGASHDGTISYRVSNSITCIVCRNTWAAVMRETVIESIKMVGDDIDTRIYTFGQNSNAQFVAINNEVEKQTNYAAMPITSNKVSEGLKLLFPATSQTKSGEDNKTAINARNDVNIAIETTLKESNSTELTIYDVLQGVARYNSHNKNTAKSTKVLVDDETGETTLIRKKGDPLRSEYDQWVYLMTHGQELMSKAETIFTSI